MVANQVILNKEIIPDYPGGPRYPEGRLFRGEEGGRRPEPKSWYHEKD